MDWSLFFIAAAIWVFFGAHVAFNARLSQMAEHGLVAPAGFMAASKFLSMTAMFNLFAFLIVYGLKISWLWSIVIVIGGYLASLSYMLIVRDMFLNITHKIGWVALPVLSIIVWVVAFAA